MDDNQRSHGARRTTASPRRATRRRASMRTPGRRRYRSGRRRSSGRGGVRGACSGALAGSSSKRSTGAVRHRSNSQPQGSAQLFPIAAGATHRSAGRLLRSQTDGDLRPVTGAARACFRTNRGQAVEMPDDPSVARPSRNSVSVVGPSWTDCPDLALWLRRSLFQAPAVTSWWRWSLATLWVAISNRLSVIVLIVVGVVRPLRLVLGLAAG